MKGQKAIIIRLDLLGVLRWRFKCWGVWQDSCLTGIPVEQEWITGCWTGIGYILDVSQFRLEMVDPSAVVHQCADDHDDEQDGDNQPADESSVVGGAAVSLPQLALVAHRWVDGNVALVSCSIHQPSSSVLFIVRLTISRRFFLGILLGFFLSFFGKDEGTKEFDLDRRNFTLIWFLKDSSEIR